MLLLPHNQLFNPLQQRLRERLQVIPCNRAWAIALEQKRHYLHQAVNNRACPLSYALYLNGEVCGLLTFGLPHFIKQRGLFGSPGLPTQWQVLILFRLLATSPVAGVVDHASGRATDAG